MIDRVARQRVSAFSGIQVLPVSNKKSMLASMEKSLDSQLLDFKSLKKQVQLVRVLVAGCKKYPAGQGTSLFIMQST
tara:strand:+ start:249 stop:479 length:231 start_codon:yes stop_codon:yes gene_type:complete